MNNKSSEELFERMKFYFQAIENQDKGKLNNNFQEKLKIMEVPTGAEKTKASIDFIENFPQRSGRVNRSVFVPSQSIFKYLIPSKRREEVLGDLIETKSDMIEEGHPIWKIRLVLFFHIVIILGTMLKLKITDYGSTNKQYIKK